MRVSDALILTLIVTGLAVLLSGCAGGGSYTVYNGYGYPYYGHGVGYRTVYYDDDFNHRRKHRTERVQNMSPAQRQHVSERLRQTQPQNVKRHQSHQVNRSTRNMIIFETCLVLFKKINSYFSCITDSYFVY